MTVTRAKVRKYSAAARIALRNRLAYRGNFAGALVTYGLFVFVFSRIWATVYADKASIAGYTRAMCVWYFVIAELVAYGFGRFYWTLDRELKNGQIAYLVARPYSFTIFQYCQAMGPAAIESAILFAEGSLIALAGTGLPPPLAGMGAGAANLTAGAWSAAARIWPEILRGVCVIVALLLSGSISFLLHLSIAMTAFWFEENAAFFWIFQKFTLIAGTLLPIEFLPARARDILRFTPFPSMAYTPARIMAAFDPKEAAALIGRQFLWVALAAALASVVYSRGTRRLAVNGG